MRYQVQEPSCEATQATIKAILIVEDDPGIGTYLIEAIRQETPYHPLLVTESIWALEMVNYITPDLFLLEHHLPALNGIDLYDHLPATEGLEAIPAIIISTRLPQEQPDQKITQRQLIALPYPHDLADLLSLIETCMV